MEQDKIGEVVKTKGKVVMAEVTGISNDGESDMLELFVCFDRNAVPELFEKALVAYAQGLPLPLVIEVDDEPEAPKPRAAPRKPATRTPRASPTPKKAPEKAEQQALVAN